VTDNGTDRALHTLVGLVTVTAMVCVAFSAFQLTGPPAVQYPLLMAALIAVTGILEVRLHVRGQHLISTTDAAVLIAIALLPWPWVVVCTAVGSGIAMLVLRRPLVKALFNTAKDTLEAAAAALVFAAVSAASPLTVPGETPWSWATYVALAAAGAAFAVVDYALLTPVLVLATRTPWRQVLALHTGVDLVVRSANFAVVVATVALYQIDPVLLAAAPLGVLFVYLAHRHQQHLREERQAWQQLAASTDALGSAGMGEVLRTALRGAADLFPDLEIEVELRRGGAPRVVRGDQTGILYDGDAAQAPARAGPTREVVLEGEPGADGPLGVLRLRFPVEVALSDREQHMLTTFAAGLSTAIRNVSAYAEVSRLAEQNAYDATHDALTDLPNRRAMNERAADLLSDPDRGTVALVLLDLDYFKEVNDTLGHDAGDQVLVEVADRLREAAGGALVARLGGDEFAILFGGMSSANAASRRAREVLECMRQPMELGGVLISLHTSAGFAIAVDGTTPMELLRRADVAMYQSKDTGRQVAVYARAKDSADLTRLALAGALPRAVEDGEFAVSFQPIVDLASGQVIGAEALTRWAHPDLGDLPPATFLGLVERSGLLGPFTETVLDRALTAAASWRAAGFDLQIAVNVSPRSLADPRLPKTVVHALETHGIEPGRLTLELTETSAIGYLDVVTQGAAKLRDAGVKIALDDFGTRHSSMSAVFQVPVNELKIDRTFVAGLDSSPEAMAVVRSIIELGRHLGLALVAEGVEEAGQRQTLWELGCTSGQGRLFGWPPQSKEDLLAALRTGFDGVPGALAPVLHPDATVVRLPRQTPRTEESEPDQQLGRQAEA
jgi:diguanylate cyclase (GGDEF)-like protein